MANVGKALKANNMNEFGEEMAKVSEHVCAMIETGTQVM